MTQCKLVAFKKYRSTNLEFISFVKLPLNEARTRLAMIVHDIVRPGGDRGPILCTLPWQGNCYVIFEYSEDAQHATQVDVSVKSVPGDCIDVANCLRHYDLSVMVLPQKGRGFSDKRWSQHPIIIIRPYRK
jgi:hypothetical protein